MGSAVMRKAVAVLSLFAVTLASGCSGSSIGTELGAAPTAAKDAKPGQGTARFAVDVPKAQLSSKGYRRRNALSLATASITITLTSVGGAQQSAAPAVIDLLPNSPSCVPDPSGETIVVCSVSVTEPAGNDTFAIAAFDEPDATGHQLSAGTVSASIPSSGSATVPLTFNPIVASITIAVTSPAVPAGVQATEQIFVEAQDAGGAGIIGSDPFVSPVTLTLTDPQHLVTLGTTTVTNPSIVPTASVNASGVASGSATIGAAVANVAASSITPATISINNDRNWNNGVTFAYAGTTTTTSTFPNEAPTTSASTNTSNESIAISGGTIVRTATTTSSAGTETQTYDYQLLGAFGTTHLDLSSYTLTDVYGGQLANQYIGENIIDELPEAPGETFPNSNSFTSVYQASNDDPSPSDTYTLNVDGSYQYQLSYGNGDVNTVSADPVAGSTYAYDFDAGGSVSYAIATPAPAGATSAIAVKQSIVAASPSPGASPISASTAAPDWYPATPSVAQNLQIDSEGDLGSQTVPAACGVAAKFGATANQIHEDYFHLDPVLGEVETESIDTYVLPGTGVLCRSNLTTLKLYYYENDFSEESAPLSTLFAGTLVATYVTQTYSGLQAVGMSSQPAVHRRISFAKPRPAGGSHRTRTNVAIDRARDSGLGGRS